MKVENEKDAELFGQLLGIESAIRFIALEVSKVSDSEDFLEASLTTALLRLGNAKASVGGALKTPDTPLEEVILSQAEAVLKAVFSPVKLVTGDLNP